MNRKDITSYEFKASKHLMPEGLSADAMRALNELTNDLRSVISSQLGKTRITTAQIRMLARVARFANVGCRVIDIAEIPLTGTKQNVSAAIGKLMRRGLISAEPDLGDRRSRRFTITKKGREILDRFMPIHMNFLVSAFSALNEDETKTLCELLTKLNQSVRQVGDFSNAKKRP